MSPFIDLRNKGLSKLIPLSNILLLCMVSNAVGVTCLATVAGSKEDSAYLHVKQKVHNLPLLQKILSMKSMKKNDIVYNEKDPLSHLSFLGKGIALANVYCNPLVHFFPPRHQVSNDGQEIGSPKNGSNEVGGAIVSNENNNGISSLQDQSVKGRDEIHSANETPSQNDNKIGVSMNSSGDKNSAIKQLIDELEKSLKKNNTSNFPVTQEVKDAINIFANSFNKGTIFSPNSKHIKDFFSDDFFSDIDVLNFKEKFSDVLKKEINAWINGNDFSIKKSSFLVNIKTAECIDAFAGVIANSLGNSFTALNDYYDTFMHRIQKNEFILHLVTYIDKNIFAKGKAMAPDNFQEGCSWIEILTNFRDALQKLK